MKLSLLALLSLATLAACGPTGAPPAVAGGSADTCPATLAACVPGSFSVCEPEATPTPACCADGAPSSACQMAAGILTHACPASCASGLCAVRGPALTCCDFGASPNPCALP